MAETPLYPIGTIAKLFDLTERRVQQLAKDNVIPKGIDGKYDLIGCVRGYVVFLRKAVEQQGSGSSNAHLKASRVELLDMQKKNAELAYLEKTGQMLVIDDVEAILIEGAATFAGQKRSMGSRLAGKLASMTDPKAILKLLNRENDAILKNTADKFSEIKNLGKGRRNIKATSAAKPKRVGRRKPSVSTGKPGAGATPE